MKHEKISIKWKLFLFLSGFTVILLVILWLFQIVYLDTFYKMIKRQELDTATDEMVEVLENETDETVIQEVMTEIASKYGLYIKVTDSDMNELYLSEYLANGSIHKMSVSEFERYYIEAQDNGGEITIKFEDGDNKTIPDMNQDMDTTISADAYNLYHGGYSPDEEVNENASTDGEDTIPEASVNKSLERVESVVQVNIIVEDGEEMVLFLNSVLTPVDSTVSTLRVQLVCISVIMILLSMVIALLMAKNISRSIIKVNNSAKKLAKGNFDVIFDGKDYLEISELSDTLNYTAKELGKTEKLQRELIANVSHDLRTPLTMLIAYSEVMRDLPGENTPENIQVIIDESKRLTNLVNDMLDISKLQAGVVEQKIHKYNLTSSIESVMERFNKLKEQDGYNITFEYSQEVFVEADEYKIFQVIYNLVNNAINYTGDDKTVRVCQVIRDEHVRIEVIDTGLGINKEDIPFVWERYYKVDKTHKRAITGTGLGLSISKNILEMYNADYGVDSIENQGSTFWFELKIVEKSK